jgi:hypothetical protein
MSVSRGFADGRHHSVLVVDQDGRRWVQVRARRWDRVLARWRDLTLDAQLAAGEQAEDNLLRAVRAGMLTAPSSRRTLAARWELVLADPTRRPSRASGRIPLQRTRVLAAQPDIRLMIAQLRAPAPVPARGVAIANLLLIDGSGPLYDAGSRTEVGAAVQDAIRYLDPYADLPASAANR